MRTLAVRIADTETGEEAAFQFSQSRIRIGRAAECELVLACDSISRHHGTVDFTDQGATYTDENSTNGSLVEGSAVRPRLSVDLKEGGTICVGHLLLTVAFCDGSGIDAVDASPVPVFPPGPQRGGGASRQNPALKTRVLLAGSCSLGRPTPLACQSPPPPQVAAGAVVIERAETRPDYFEREPPAIVDEFDIAAADVPIRPVRPNPQPDPTPSDLLDELERIAAQEPSDRSRALIMSARTALEVLAKDLAKIRFPEQPSEKWRELLADAFFGVVAGIPRWRPSPAEDPRSIREEPAQPAPQVKWPETTVLKRPPQPPRLVALNEDAGAPFCLLDKADLSIGRGDDCDIVIPHSSVSRSHARIVAEGPRWTILDLDSANGVFVNGERYQSAEIKHGYLVQIGKVQFRVSFLAEAADSELSAVDR